MTAGAVIPETLAGNELHGELGGLRQRLVQRGVRTARELPALLRRHWLLTLLFLAALLVRVLAFAAYRHGIVFPDSGDYLLTVRTGVPSMTRPAGYSWFLTPFALVHRSALVVLVQHMLGLALLVGAYAFLISRGIRRWLGTLAVLPLGLDGRLVSLESFLLAETLFIVLLFAGIALLTWRPPLPLSVAVLTGLLFSSAALTRTVGLPLGALAVVYLLLRRAGWRAIAGFVVALVVPIGLYAVYYHHHHGVYALGEFQGRTLYGRTATFSDCAKLTLPADLTWLCLETPVSQRSQRTDIYVWTDNNPAVKAHGIDHVSDDELLGRFGRLAITQQFGDYLAVVVRETGWHLVPGTGPTDGQSRCLMGAWVMPGERSDLCQTVVANTSYFSRHSDAMYPTHPYAGLRRVLHEYAVATVTPRLVVSLLLLVPIVALLWPRRRTMAGERRNADRGVVLDGVFISAVGLALLVIPVATVMFEVRYAVPSLAFLPIGAALTLSRFPFARRSDG